jgi:hypothetical protein
MGIPITDDTCLYILQFADHQVLVAGEKEDLEYMTRKLKEEYGKWGLDMNIQKTKYLCVEMEQTHLIAGNDKFESCSDYKYLAMIFDKTRTERKKIQKVKIEPEMSYEA